LVVCAILFLFIEKPFMDKNWTKKIMKLKQGNS
jgi:hypothetical protein